MPEVLMDSDYKATKEDFLTLILSRFNQGSWPETVEWWKTVMQAVQLCRQDEVLIRLVRERLQDAYLEYPAKRGFFEILNRVEGERMIRVESVVTVYEVDGKLVPPMKESISIRSHTDNHRWVVLQVDGKKITVNASDLEAAIRNAQNTGDR
jgi:hypothetical protein